MNEVLYKKVIQFRDDRDWRQFHNPKDLAISLSLEVAELLENFQWSSSVNVPDNKLDSVKEELADVLIYSILMADAIGVDIDEIIENKLSVNAEKYPIEKAFGRKEKYTEL